MPSACVPSADNGTKRKAVPVGYRQQLPARFVGDGQPVSWPVEDSGRASLVKGQYPARPRHLPLTPACTSDLTPQPLRHGSPTTLAKATKGEELAPVQQQAVHPRRSGPRRDHG